MQYNCPTCGTLINDNEKPEQHKSVYEILVAKGIMTQQQVDEQIERSRREFDELMASLEEEESPNATLLPHVWFP